MKNKLKRKWWAAGWPTWGGGRKLMHDVVYPIMAERGIVATSGKRKESFGNTSSDHFWLNLKAFAKDWATSNNQALAQAIRQKLTPGEVHVDYEHFYFEWGGHRFRGQIIAAEHGTGPHLHIGFKRED